MTDDDFKRRYMRPAFDPDDDVAAKMLVQLAQVADVKQLDTLVRVMQVFIERREYLRVVLPPADAPKEER